MGEHGREEAADRALDPAEHDGAAVDAPARVRLEAVRVRRARLARGDAGDEVGRVVQAHRGRLEQKQLAPSVGPGQHRGGAGRAEIDPQVVAPHAYQLIRP
ncbi:hypothetical protein ACPPVO_17020 [Dactylosporangium sp. McL0621]|uniref:hypothetical protein n=1 Tax=Dactylosporangium sp. McL0621 TaxID=3415678 RepID=UPI003CF7B1A1